VSDAIRVAVIGANGRMGSEVCRAVTGAEGLELVGQFDAGDDLGDLGGAALSGYIVLTSARLGAPASTLLRMLINIAIDTVVGSVPVLGDMFDVGWRANMKNADLLEAHIGGSVQSRRANRLIVAGVVAGLFLLAVGATAIGIIMIRFLVRIAT
jgi:hypothetical protein